MGKTRGWSGGEPESLRSSLKMHLNAELLARELENEIGVALKVAISTEAAAVERRL